MLTRTTRACLIAASLCVSSSFVVAAEMPRQGSSMDDVRKQFGSPAADLGGVGNPAITRWVYENFTVYFEGRRVIQTVETQALHGSTQQAPLPTPPPVQQPVAKPVVTPPAFTPAPTPVPAVTAAPVAEVPVIQSAPAAPAAPAAPLPPAIEPPVAAAPVSSPVSAPAAAPAPAPASGPAGNGFRFDPATGRLVIDSDDKAAAETPDADSDDTVAPSAAAPAAPEPEAPAAPEGTPRTDAPPSTPMEETLEFDPETGTFKPKAG